MNSRIIGYSPSTNEEELRKINWWSFSLWWAPPKYNGTNQPINRVSCFWLYPVQRNILSLPCWSAPKAVSGRSIYGIGWQHRAILNASNSSFIANSSGSGFGRQLSISADGNTEVVGATTESSSSKGIDYLIFTGRRIDDSPLRNH